MKKIRKKAKQGSVRGPLNIPAEVDEDLAKCFPEGMEPMALAFGPIIGQVHQLEEGQDIRPSLYPMLTTYVGHLKDYVDAHPEEIGTATTHRLLIGDDEFLIFFKAMLDEMKLIYIDIANEVVLDSPGDEDIMEHLKEKAEEVEENITTE